MIHESSKTMLYKWVRKWKYTSIYINRSTCSNVGACRRNIGGLGCAVILRVVFEREITGGQVPSIQKRREMSLPRGIFRFRVDPD
jgi:hypothetical protein